MQYSNEVVLCYITEYKRLLVVFSGQAREKAGSESWRVFVVNTMFSFLLAQCFSFVAEEWQGELS